MASSPRVKFATALVLSCIPLRSAYNLTLAMMYSEKLTRSPASPLVAKSLWLSMGTSLSSSCFMVMMLCTAEVSLQTSTKSFPRIPAQQNYVRRHHAIKKLEFQARSDVDNGESSKHSPIRKSMPAGKLRSDAQLSDIYLEQNATSVREGDIQSAYLVSIRVNDLIYC